MNLILFFYFLAHLANGWVMMRPISSHFGYSLAPLLEWSQSEGRAKAEWRQSVYYIIPKKPKIRVPLLRKKSGTTLQKASAKKVHFLCRANATSRSKVAPDDNNNNNRDETLFPLISQIARQT